MKIKITLLLVAVLSVFVSDAANYFWVGGSGSWSDYSSHWAVSSGGSVFHTQVPQSTDNVYFDANSFASAGQTITVDQPIVQCANMNWASVTNTPSFTGDYSNTLKIYGSLTLASAMDFNFEGPISFESTVAGRTITTAGKAINSSVTFNGAGGGWTLTDALTANWIYLNSGTLNTNNQTINAFAFTSTTSLARTLNLGTSTINLSFYGPMWNINPTGMSMNAASSTIKGVATSGGAQDFYGGGFTYNNVLFTGTQAGKINGNSVIHDVTFAADGYIQGQCTFNNVYFNADAFLTIGSIFNNVTIAGDGAFISSNTFNNLTLSPNHSYKLQPGETQTINASLGATGHCGALIDIHSGVSGSQATIAKASGAVALSYVTLRDIKATGGATFAVNNASDLGNNTGWTISSGAAKSLYWVGNSGNWSDGNHWSLTSGGVPVGCSPTPMDNVYFDANSFTSIGEVVTVNVSVASANNMVWTGVTNTPEFYGDYSSTLKIYGSLTLANGMDFNFSGPLSFESNTLGNSIVSAGNTITTSITFNGLGGSWTLQDDLTCDYWIYLNQGTLNTNNQTVNAYAFSSTTTAPRTLNMGSSVFNLSFNGSIWEINPAGMSLNSGSSTIYGVGFTGGEQYFYGGGFTYNDVLFVGAALGKIIDSNTMNNVSFGADGYIQGGTFNNIDFGADAVMYYNNTCNDVKVAKNTTVYGSNTFNSLELSPGYTCTLAAGEIQTINTVLTASGNCGRLIEIRSSVPGTAAVIKKSNGVVTLSYISLKDINVSGGAVFIANNINDLGNNTGWATALLTPLTAKNLYWVGNSGNWDDGSHWALTSGGLPAGCSPTSIDNAFFDVNSFTAPGQTVTVNVPAASVKNMVCTGVSNSPVLYGDYANALKIYGSLTLSAGLTLDFTGPVIFESTTGGQTITTAGTVFNTSLHFNGIGGSWTLQDDLKTNYWIYLNNGTLNTNNKAVNAYAFSSTTTGVRALNMGSSVFNLSFNGLIWEINPAGMTLNAGASVINGVGANGGQQDFFGGGFTYNNIHFIGSAFGKIIDNNTINDVSFNADGFILGGTFHDITFNSNAIMYYTNICNNVTIAKNAEIKGSNTFNLLKLSPGYTYTFAAGETQTIIAAGNICAEGTGSLPIRIQSSDDGVPATISKASGTLCWDYVRISDLNAIGGATFNAGLAPVNSQDMGGNTGFVFTGGCFPLGCAPCVAPVISAQPANASVCSGSGSSVSFAVTAAGTGITYQWQLLQGTAYVNVNNVFPYSGATSAVLTISSSAGLNGAKYRCVVSGACGSPLISSVASLAVNALPVVSAAVSGSTVTVTASGGTSPYTGTGAFMGLANGTYSYTVTDAKGCSATVTATVTVSSADNTAPVAKCKNATITLVNGTATLAASAVNNGSYDNVGITGITVAPATFTCANIGANTVTLTVKDAKGNTATCQSVVTVMGSIPSITITQGVLPDFWQGGAIVLTANASAGSTYLWNSGETAAVKNVYASGTCTVTVKNSYGCTATKSTTVAYNAAALLSSYMLLAKEEINLENCSYVQSGGAGVLKSSGDIDVKSNSKITGTGTFASAKYISVASSAVVTQKIYAPAAVTLPVYRYNPYCESSYNAGNNGNHDENANSWYYYGNSCNNNSNNNYYNYYGNNNNNNNSHNNNNSGWGNNNNNCNNSNSNGWGNNNNNHNNNCNNNNHNNNGWGNNNSNCNNNNGWGNNSNNNCNNNNNSNNGWGNNNGGNNNSNCNQTTRDKYVGNNTTVTLSDSIYSDITIGNNATVTFSQPVVYIKSITTGSNTKINFTGCTEIKICGKVVIGEYNVFNLAAKGVVIYSDEEVEIRKGTNFTASVYTRKDLQTEGTSSARVVMKGMFIANKVKSDYTTWNWNTATTGCSFTRSVFVANTDELSEGAVLEDMDINVFPNPSADNFSVVLNSENTAPYAVKVYDMAGRLMYSNVNIDPIEVLSFGQDLQKGVYLMNVSQGYNSKTLRIVKTE